MEKREEIFLKWKSMEADFSYFKGIVQNDVSFLSTYDVSYFEDYMKKFLKNFKELYFDTKKFLDENVK